MNHRFLVLIMISVLLCTLVSGCVENRCDKDECNEEEGYDDDDNDDASDPGDCAACHPVQAEAWENFSSHNALYDCTYCHMEIKAEPATGHRAKPWCDSCHSEETHIPTYFGEEDFQLITCLACHDPHGSTNIYLVRPEIVIGPGETAIVDFQNTSGMAEASYADNGSGLCEVCHEATEYYNRFGTGDLHETTRCTDCHSHSEGFPRRQ